MTTLIETGSAMYPKLCFGNDWDTGIFIKSDDQFGFALDGIEVPLDEWIKGLQEKQHIDLLHAKLIRVIIFMLERRGI